MPFLDLHGVRVRYRHAGAGAGRDRQHHWRVAAGSADEVVAYLRVAEAWGWVDAADIAEPIALADRVLAMYCR